MIGSANILFEDPSCFSQFLNRNYIVLPCFKNKFTEKQFLDDGHSQSGDTFD